MSKMILAAATALSMVAVPATAQDRETVELNKDGMTMQSGAHVDELTEQQRAEYEAWPEGVRSYYITLEPTDRETFWYLDDEQRIQLYEMTEADRVRAWTSINAQMAERRMTETNWVSNEMVQTIPTPVRTNHDGEYPICESEMDDHCINAWAAGERGPNVDRPLQYWPGESATDMRSGG